MKQGKGMMATDLSKDPQDSPRTVGARRSGEIGAGEGHHVTARGKVLFRLEILCVYSRTSANINNECGVLKSE
jgi:hypothetical protein